MSLTEYKRKRHFQTTPEPKGKKKPPGGRSFTVQKHDASHLHYDFRLEMDGVLKSWAVPKGPSLDPKVKRLAMHVEDHPVDYGTFEGTIPQGEYGGGTVLLWDHGEWEPEGDPLESYRAGRLEFTLHGEKLHGRWLLVRTGGKGKKRDGLQWLLFKAKDEAARVAEEYDILVEEPLSVSTGRDLPDIAAGKVAKKKKKGTRSRRGKTPGIGVPHPGAWEVQLATLAKEAPVGAEWIHEIKLDGYRMICRIDDGEVRFFSRNHKDWTSRFPTLVDAATKLKAANAILDGEVVGLNSEGISDFQILQNAFRAGRTETLEYHTFDLLFCDGRDLRTKPLEERKRELAKIVAGNAGPLRLSEHFDGRGDEFLDQACKLGLEGIISKRKDSRYAPGRGLDWLKIKCIQTDEFVIGGYTDPAKSRVGLGALLLGYHDAEGNLVYAGRVGTGFDQRSLIALAKQLRSLRQDASPFINFRRGAKTHWVQPKLVAQVAFGAWTRDGLLRHASFRGLREDKPATVVTREKPIAEVDVKAKPVSKTEREYDARNQTFAGVRLTSPEKILYAEQGITKVELAEYYRDVAEWILPHVKDRPLVLVRCPEGQGGQCFYQKHPAAGSPKAFRLIPIQEKEKTDDYVMIDDVAGLISLAQVGALEVHAWGSRADDIEKPDRIIFDLDPDPAVKWPRVVEAARQVRQFLADLGLETFVKTTGGKGLHLVAPIERRHDWDEVKEFCKGVADAIVAADPEHYIAKMSKAARKGKIFIDYLRNDRGSTAVAPYSTRAKPNASISAPLTWKELSPRVASDKYTVRNIRQRLARLDRDPWKEFAGMRQSLRSSIAKLNAISRRAR